MNEQHKLKSFMKDKTQIKFDAAQDSKGPKKMLRFFNNYVIEVKTEKKFDRISIYDFDNKLNVYSKDFPEIL